MWSAVYRREDEERERVRVRLRLQAQALPEPAWRTLALPAFLSETKIENPISDALVPFIPWPAQLDVLRTLEVERLIILLKARQLGISWLLCGYILRQCLARSSQTWLMFSQGQLEANELIRRIGLLETNHSMRAEFPKYTTDNMGERAWANGSRVISLPVTPKSGRSFTASGVLLDEYAFMQWGPRLMGAVKPTIDAGGQMAVVSSADGEGSSYHQFWQHAEAGKNGYWPIFLPWTARPDRDAGWRDRKLIESGGDTATILREYPENPLEAFSAATGCIFDCWLDGPPDGNVTDAAEYQADAESEIIWAVDDGYAGQVDATTGHFTPDSHPRVFLLAQIKADGHIDIFCEDYAVKVLSAPHIQRILELPYPEPDYAVVDSSAAELRGMLHEMGIGTYGKPDDVEESIKVTQRMLAPDENGWRRIRVHPRCVRLRREMGMYRRDETGKIVKKHDHGVDALRYLAWKLRRG
jgi:hypothetical protein